MVERQSSKLITRVRFSSSAFLLLALVAQGIEQEPSKLLVEGSNPSERITL